MYNQKKKGFTGMFAALAPGIALGPGGEVELTHKQEMRSVYIATLVIVGLTFLMFIVMFAGVFSNMTLLKQSKTALTDAVKFINNKIVPSIPFSA